MANTIFFRNSKNFLSLMVYLGVFAAIWACEEDIEPTISDPSVSILFLNQTKLTEVDYVVDSLDDELAYYDLVITSLEASADDLADSLIVLTDSIANGGDLEQERATVVHDLDTLNIYLRGIEMQDSAANANRIIWADTATTINSGALKVSSIKNLKNGLTITYEDSSANWRLPLDMQADDVDLDITIDGTVYNLGLGYSRSTTANEKNKVVIRTSNFEILSTDFNNPSLSCQDCDDTKATIYVEF